jgi:hypothetical protein
MTLEGARMRLRRWAQIVEYLQLVFGVDDTRCEACGRGGWPRSPAVMLLLMWGEELPRGGQVFDAGTLES